jgi:hypothetical protein
MQDYSLLITAVLFVERMQLIGLDLVGEHLGSVILEMNTSRCIL